MEILFILLTKLLPLYALILLGVLAGKRLYVQKESIAPLLIYIIAPIVILDATVAAPLRTAVLSLPVVFFLIACVLCLVFYALGSRLWQGAEKNILAFTAGSGNTGYFGIPLTLVLLGDQAFVLAALATLGMILYENSVGFYMAARGSVTSRQAIGKVLRLPSLYTFIIGVLLNAGGLHFSGIVQTTLGNVRGAYIVLGMMMVGLGLAQVTRLSFDLKFTAMAFLAKFVAWPAVIVVLIMTDRQFFGLFNPTTNHVLLLLSLVPLASNTVAFATQLRVQPEKAAVAVFLSTLFSLLYIPIMISALSFFWQ